MPSNEGGRFGLPPFHVARPRLVSELAPATVGVIEAAAGYGKSVLVSELRTSLGIANAWLTLGPPDNEPQLLAASMARAFRSANLSDLAAVLAVASAPDWSERFLDALSRAETPLLLVLDDVHWLTESEACAAVLRLARGFVPPHHVVLTARRLPAALGQLRDVPGATWVGAEDLSFNSGETATLAASLLGRPVSPDEVGALLTSTGGWGGALVLAVRAMQSGAAYELVPTASLGPHGTIASLMGPLIEVLSPRERDALIQLAHLPYFSPQLAEAISGAADFFQRAVLAGAPVLRTGAGRWQMAGPVTGYLASLAPLTRRSAEEASSSYSREGDVPSALRMLMTSGFREQAASLLAGLAPHQADELGWAEISDAIERMPPGVVRRHPRALLNLARSAESAYRGDVRRRALDRAAQILEAGNAKDGPLIREFRAEQSRDLLADERQRERAWALARAVMDNSSPLEEVARVRAVGTLGRLRSWWSADGPHDDAKEFFEEEVRLAQRLKQPAWEARALASLGMGLHFGLCRYRRALETLDQALALIPPRNPYRGFLINFRLTVLCALGLFEESEASLAEMNELSALFGEDWLTAYSRWSELEIAAYMRDKSRAIRAAQQVLEHKSSWFDENPGTEFLAQGAEFLDRAGANGLAADLLAQAKERMTGFERVVCVYESSVLARSGDPHKAEDSLAATLARPDLDPQERWPLQLMRAYAALRRGDERAGRLAAEAFEYCENMAIADAPMVREPSITEALLPAARAAGSTAAVAIAAGAARVSLSVLGGFDLRRGVRRLHPPPGLPTETICVVAAAGGRVRAEQLIESLWPAVGPDAGRNRLKNILSRLRVFIGDVLVRSGQMVVIAPGSTIDAVLFESEARLALKARANGDHLQAAALARSAVDRYRGDLAPAFAYFAWAAEPRERARLLYLELLDLLVAHAEATGEVDEAARLVQRAIQAEPYDEDRYVKLARLFTSQGRTGSAHAVLRRAGTVLESLGLSGIQAPGPSGLYPERSAATNSMSGGDHARSV